MSAFLYGRISSHAAAPRPALTELARRVPEHQAAIADAASDNKLVGALAAIVPAEILAAHALILTFTTTTDDAGTTTITEPDVLRWSFVALVIAGAALYAIGHWNAPWGPADAGRLLLPPVAFVGWAALSGTSALTPWIPAGVPHAALPAFAAVLAIIVLALSAKLSPSS